MMISAQELTLFAAAALLMVLTPGPNMVYLVSRSLSQGWRAASISLSGVAVGFLFHMLLAAFGLTALLMAVPYVYDLLKFCGAAYLLWLAWQAIRPGGQAVFNTRDLPPDTALKMFSMGFITNALNPKIAIFYLSIFTSFIHPERGPVFLQSLVLGGTQIFISVSVNFLIILAAGHVSRWFTTRPLWTQLQKWATATVLTTFAVKLAVSHRK